jgi:hypothetical protein
MSSHPEPDSGSPKRRSPHLTAILAIEFLVLLFVWAFLLFGDVSFVVPAGSLGLGAKIGVTALVVVILFLSWRWRRERERKALELLDRWAAQEASKPVRPPRR